MNMRPLDKLKRIVRSEGWNDYDEYIKLDTHYSKWLSDSLRFHVNSHYTTRANRFSSIIKSDQLQITVRHRSCNEKMNCETSSESEITMSHNDMVSSTIGTLKRIYCFFYFKQRNKNDLVEDNARSFEMNCWYSSIRANESLRNIFTFFTRNVFGFTTHYCNFKSLFIWKKHI